MKCLSKGKPKNCELSYKMQNSRTVFKSALKIFKRNEANEISQSVEQSFKNKNSKEFWKSIKNINSKHFLIDMIDGSNKDIDIAHLFQNTFLNKNLQNDSINKKKYL